MRKPGLSPMKRVIRSGRRESVRLLMVGLEGAALRLGLLRAEVEAVWLALRLPRGAVWARVR